MINEEIIAMTVTELSESVRKREVSPLEIYTAYKAAMENSEPLINAYTEAAAERAQADIRNAERILASGETISPLCGVPYAVKDNIAVEGIRMTCASRMLKDFIPSYTASVCGKVKLRGGILLGKTNLDEFAMGSSTEKSIFGATHNPWNPEKTAGGSSGGSAAAVAVRSAAWALGSDTGGSARHPAALCGVCAMKPTYGLVSRYGLTEFASSMDAISPITRNVSDNALILSCLAGRDKKDMTTLAQGNDELDYLSDITSGVCGLRIGIPNNCDEFVSPCVVKSLWRAAEIMRISGAETVLVNLPFLSDSVEIYQALSSAEASSNLARYNGIAYGGQITGETSDSSMTATRDFGFGDEVKRRILAGAYVLSANAGEYYLKIKDVCDKLCAQISELFDKIDVLLIPTAGDTAFELGSSDKDPTSMYGSDRFTVMANLTGYPAITIPAGGSAGLPIGVTFMGKKLSEKLLYRTAFTAECELAIYNKNEIYRKEAAE